MILNKEHKVFEVNNMVALRSGHIIAQSPLYIEDYFDSVPTDDADKFIDNGCVLYLDIDGKLKKPGQVNDVAKKSQPLIHYTEELIPYGYRLKDFTVYFKDDIAYPRMLANYVGDTFTTNNFQLASGATLENATVATVDNNGVLTLHDSIGDVTGYNGPIWNVVETTLPDGETPAAEFTLINNYVEIL